MLVNCGADRKNSFVVFSTLALFYVSEKKEIYVITVSMSPP